MMYKRSPADWPLKGITSRSIVRVPPLDDDAQALFSHRPVFFSGPGQRVAEIHLEILASHFRQAERRMAGRGLQIGSDLSAELHDFHVAIDDDAAGNEAVRQNPLHFPIHVKSRIRDLGRVDRFQPRDRDFRADNMRDHARAGPLFLVDLVFLVDQREQVLERSQAFRRPQHQVPARFQGIVKSGNGALLQNGAEIDQQIPATDQVQIGERRVLDDILLCENAHFPDGFMDLVSPVVADEETAEPLLGNSRNLICRIDAGCAPDRGRNR